MHGSLQHSSHVSMRERLPIHLESCCSNRTGISLDAQPHSENFFDVLDDVIAGSASLWDLPSCFVNPAQLKQNDDESIRLEQLGHVRKDVFEYSEN